MTNDFSYSQQKYSLYIQKVLKVNQEELAYVLTNYGVSAKKIVQCMKQAYNKRAQAKMRDLTIEEYYDSPLPKPESGRIRAK